MSINNRAEMSQNCEITYSYRGEKLFHTDMECLPSKELIIDNKLNLWFIQELKLLRVIPHNCWAVVSYKNQD